MQPVQPSDTALQTADCRCVWCHRPQVSVSLQSGSLRVCVKDGAEDKTLMEGEFTHKINTENSLWSLEPGQCVLVSPRARCGPVHVSSITLFQVDLLKRCRDVCDLQLSLSKTSEVWWNAVLKGEKEIDINQINRERSMATVDDDEHAVLDRLTFDYQQKLQGKPQSHEMVRTMTQTCWCPSTIIIITTED